MSRIKESIVLAIAVLGLGAFLYSGIVNAKQSDRYVNVRGFAERTM